MATVQRRQKFDKICLRWPEDYLCEKLHCKLIPFRWSGIETVAPYSHHYVKYTD